MNLLLPHHVFIKYLPTAKHSSKAVCMHWPFNPCAGLTRQALLNFTFTNDLSAAQRSQTTCRGNHSQRLVEPRYGPRRFGSDAQADALSPYKLFKNRPAKGKLHM